ncbi:MAG: RNA polymerase sigma factor [Myxococcota bacterium]
MSQAADASTAVDAHVLLQRWAEGDRESGARLYRLYFPMIYRFFRTKVSEGVEDLVQSTFAAGLEARDRFRGDSKFSTFLYGVARNQLLSHFRKVDKHRAAALEVSVADFGTSPSGHLARDEAQRRLYDALCGLPIDHQIAIELHYWEGLSSREIAEIVGEPEPTVRTRIRRARIKLRAVLAPNEA